MPDAILHRVVGCSHIGKLGRRFKCFLTLSPEKKFIRSKQRFEMLSRQVGMSMNFFCVNCLVNRLILVGHPAYEEEHIEVLLSALTPN